MNDIDRRAFVCRVAEVLSLAAVGGCASVAAVRLPSADGALVLDPSEHPQLLRPDGYLRVQAEGSSAPIYLLRNGEADFVALSPICTHQGCTVNVEGDRLVCPCHGSTFSRDGGVLRGPAADPLRRYPTRTGPDGSLVVQLEGPP